MKKLTIVLGIIFSCAVGVSLASTVSTTDGKNFAVINDGGTLMPMTNQQIEQKVNQYNQAYLRDEVQAGSDQETFIVWNGVEQMAINAEAVWQANQVNGS